MYNCADVQEAHETAQQSPFTAKRMPPPTLCHTLRPERNPLARQLGCERQGPRFPQFSVPAMSRLESKPVQRHPSRQDQRERYRAVAVRSDICCERLGIGVGNDADLAVPVATAQRLTHQPHAERVGWKRLLASPFCKVYLCDLKRLTKWLKIGHFLPLQFLPNLLKTFDCFGRI